MSGGDMRAKKCKTLIWCLFFIYILIVLLLTVFRFGASYAERQINLTLFVDLINIYRNYGAGLFLWLFLGNIFWFVPFGFLLPLLLERHRFVKTMLAGFLFSLAIETLQFVFYKGVAELDDLILNSLGVLIGFCLCKLFNKYIVNRGII
jgi:glycopeptide antibiotics resistance protein